MLVTLLDAIIDDDLIMGGNKLIFKTIIMIGVDSIVKKVVDWGLIIRENKLYL